MTVFRQKGNQPVQDTHSAEAYIIDRYKKWQKWQARFDYKHAKGERIARIVAETGVLEPVALELGVGPGGVAVALSRHGIAVIGMDLSPDALVRAQEHCRSENVRLIRASGFSIPFGEHTVGLIYASQVLHLFDAPDRLAIMREVHRVLKPGGRFIFDMKNVWSHPLRYFRSSVARRRRNFPSRSEIYELLDRAGFSDVTTLPGLLPLVRSTSVPNIGVFRQLAHTIFYVAKVIPGDSAA